MQPTARIEISKWAKWPSSSKPDYTVLGNEEAEKGCMYISDIGGDDQLWGNMT